MLARPQGMLGTKEISAARLDAAPAEVAEAVSDAVLSGRARRHPVRRSDRTRRLQPDGRHGRSVRAHRPQRCRQDHRLQPPHWRVPPHHRRDPRLGHAGEREEAAPDQPSRAGEDVPEHPALQGAHGHRQRTGGAPRRGRAPALLEGRHTAPALASALEQLLRLVARPAAHARIPSRGAGGDRELRIVARGDGPPSPPRRGFEEPPLRRAAAPRDRARARHAPQRAPPRRACRRHEYQGEDRSDGPDPAAPRALLARDPGDRARHEAGDGDLRDRSPCSITARPSPSVHRARSSAIPK